MTNQTADDRKPSASDRGQDERPATDPSRSVRKTPDQPESESRKHQEDLLDEALEETFPSSDPISPKHIT